MILKLPWVGLALCLFSIEAWPVTPTAEELAAAAAWFDDAFAAKDADRSRMEILFEDVPEAITRRRSWRGTPFQIGERTYTHGIAFNSTKHLLVRLSKPARRFTAEVGLENNDDTRRGEQLGQGSVTFHVLVHGEEVLSTPVRRRQDAAVPLDVALRGAREFEIRVGNGGDGRGWDQALWAEGMVHFEDGSSVRLQNIRLQQSGSSDFRPFSFVCREKNSAATLGDWSCQELDSNAPSNTQRQVVWKDPDSGLEMRAEAELFGDFPAVEWLLRFTNSSRTNSPLLENIQALDCLLPMQAVAEPKLHWAKGGVASFDDFAPQSALLKQNSKHRLQSGEGRSSSQVLPFFNVEGVNGGVIVAIGWTGEWAAEFSCDNHKEVRAKAGLHRTHLSLHPAETIRTPRILLLFYEGDRQRGQNLLRQFLLTHHRPRPNGKPLVAPITCGNWGGTRAEVHLDNIQKIARQQLPIAYYWIDAEWYGKGGWPMNVGNWQVKKDLYPGGFAPLSEALRRSGRELMLWFEPERVFRGTPWHKQHLGWLLATGGENLLFNLGLPEARQFLIDFISARIDEFGLGCYRQDFNIDPLPFWQAADAPDRQGMAETKYIEGLYAFWDELLRRHPGLIIDNCASGGRRIDLETVGRATPFWRTDGPRDPVAHQCHSHGLLSWIPLSATSQDRAGDDYEFCSSMCSGLCLNWWVAGDAPAERIPDSFPFDWARKTLTQYLSIRDCYYGDFYPLTAYSQAPDVWMAYQLDRPDSGRGMLVALRRPESPYETARIVPQALMPEAVYSITDLDDGSSRSLSGQELRNRGVLIELPASPGSKVLVYQRR